MSCSRTVALAAALLWGGVNVAAAQEPPRRFDVFAGGGVAFHDYTSSTTVEVGGGVWATQHLRVGVQFGLSGYLGLLSTHLRLPINNDIDLLVGTTPVWYAPGQGAYIAPPAEGFVSGRISPLLRVEFGTGVYLGEGGYVHWTGRLVYSFN